MSGSHRQRRRGKAVFTGGKNSAGTYQTIINLIPPHRFYAEPFCGSAAVLLHKRPAAQSVVCDLDPKAVAAVKARISEAGMPDVTASVLDGMALLRNLQRNDPTTFVYADPPYLAETRRDPTRSYYAHEWSDDDHLRFLRLVKKMACRVMVSSYPCSLYDSELGGAICWSTTDFHVMTRGGPAVERLWMNYPPPAQLHDYRYVGGSYDERWRIHKRQRSWARMLNRMPDLERRAMLAATIDEFRGEVLEYLDTDLRQAPSPEPLSAGAAKASGPGPRTPGAPAEARL